MGFFSGLATDIYEEIHKEDLLESRERQLLLRLEDLKYRLEELKEDCLQRNKLLSEQHGMEEIYDGRRLMKEDLMYAIPRDLHTIPEVNKAIQLVEDELNGSKGIVDEKDDTELKNDCERDESVAA